jgi:glutamate synthase (NADPH/NADH) small chain
MDDNKGDGIRAGRLSPEQYAANFGDSHAPLNRVQALIEADRCYYCYDAPCINACPTGIDIPTFIQRIAQDNVRGAAKAILEENILGGMCARVCPTEVLCEQACVRNTNEDKPVEIGLLQRYATDGYFAKPGAPLFTRARRAASARPRWAPVPRASRSPTASRCSATTWSCSTPTRRRADSTSTASPPTRPSTGSRRRRSTGCCRSAASRCSCNKALGRDIVLDDLVREYDAVFLGMGLAGVNALGVAEPQAAGLRDAVRFIAELRQAKDYSKVPIGRRVVVIGGGMTAVDAAVQSKKLGAEDVTIVYRRGEEAMSASGYEQDWAKRCGVTIKLWAAPKEVLAEGGQVRGVRFAYTRSDNGKLVETGDSFTIPADTVFRAIGQTYVAAPAGAAIALRADASSPTARAAHRSRRSGRAATAPTAGATSRWRPSSTASAPRSPPTERYAAEENEQWLT